MIKQVSVNNLNVVNTQKPSKNQPQFKGGIVDVMTAGIQACEQYPMVNVAVLDLSTAIIPRTYVEGKTNPYAGAEAFRRESSGLIVNCMIPSLIVLGIAKALEKPMMGGASRMAGCWANGDTIDLVADQWQNLKNVEPVMENGKVLYTGDKAKVYRTIENILKETKGIDGKEVVDFAEKDFHQQIKSLTENTFAQKINQKEVKSVYKSIAEATHATENIKIGKTGKFSSQNLESIISSTPKLLRELVGGKDVATFASKAKKLVNYKSLGGLALILPLAISMQPINRWLTAKSSGKKGAPIYKDFGDTKEHELSPKEKSALLKQKFISIGSMVGVALLSMSMGGKFKDFFSLQGGAKILQFKGLFPTMDQARIISTATFASRMGASEDKNDLREATFRDIATFSSFYFLGDYVAKGIATGIQKMKPHIKLINDLNPLDKDAGFFKRIKHWTKDTALKSSDEVVGKTAKNMRTFCQLGNIVFSLIALGIVIPKMYRGQTNKKREEELKAMGVDQKTIDKYYHHLVKNNPNFASNRATYQALQK